MKKTILNIVERVVATFAAALLGVVTVAGATISHIHWGTALDIAGTAALVTLLKCAASLAVTGTPSLAIKAPQHGRHEAAE